MHSLVGNVVGFEARTQPGAWLQVDWLPKVLNIGSMRGLFPALQARKRWKVPLLH